MSRFTGLVNIALLLALLVITLGAYTRLTDAGLGCPDWPGCYGKLTAPVHEGHVAELQQQFPDAKIVPHKAHNEMLHRYIAGLFGLTVLAIFIASLIQKRFRKLTSCILMLVIFQAALGMWTVTLNLLPLVVLGHLVGGFALFSLLALLRAEIAWQTSAARITLPIESKLGSLLPLGYAVVLVLILQIILGGWTSSNYAATVCYQLPFCEPGWTEHFSLQSAVTLPLGEKSYEFGVLPYEARMSIHVLHRVGAIATFLLLSFFCFSARRRATSKFMRLVPVAIATLLVLQVTLGLINIRAQLPLLNAVAHNVVAANLLMLLLVFVRQMYVRRAAKINNENHS
jgi:heme a synthase